MRKLILTLFTITLTGLTNAQVTTPQPSPLSKTTQKVGMTTITVEYSRPGVKERTIFGDLVPYGELWRTGANSNTKVTFDTEITIGEQVVAAGTYALFTIPNKDSWEFFFYKDSENWGLPKKWDDTKVAAKATGKAFPVPFNVETMAIDFNEIKSDRAVLEIIWEKTYVSIPFHVPTEKIVMASIQKTMDENPKVNDYYAAAVYYYETNHDINQAKKWIDKAVKMQKKQPKFWVLRKQALIHHKAGDTKSAIKAAKKSLELAKEANNEAYVKMNEDSLIEWSVKL